MENLVNNTKAISNQEDFLAFIKLLIEDFKTNGNNWENKTLDTYLEAIESWTEDMDGYYLNTNQKIPENINWQVFANILRAATMYE